MSAPLIMVLAGGTGGHVYPALAVASELRARGYRLRWVGTRRGLESRVVPAAGIALHCLPVRGLRGKSALARAWSLLVLGASVAQSLLLLLRLRPRMLVGMGGYASFPAAFAGWLLRRPLLLQEQNAVPGSANRALARFAARIATGFPAVFNEYQQARYLGNPVRAEILGVAVEQPWQWQAERPLRVLVLGGSLGALPLNLAIPAAADKLAARCEWWHQCGDAHVDPTRAHYASQAAGAAVRVEPFIEDMAAAYGWADLVVSRAGALTVAELAATGRPAVLVPLPQAIDDHQTANARFLADGGAAVLMPQPDLETGALTDTLETLLAMPERMGAMSAAALSLARPQAVTDIADCCEELLT